MDWLALCASGRHRKEVVADGEKFGDVVNETFIAEDAGDLGDYVKLVQRIKRMDGGNWIRFTYYVKRPGWTGWRIAGQNSLWLSLSDAKRLLRKATDAGIL